MKQFTEPPIVESPEEDQDSPIEDALPINLEPTQYLNTEDGTVTIPQGEVPIRTWREYHDDSSPVSRKHSLSPTSPSSAPICQRTSREGSYQSITPAASSPIASTSPQSPGHQSTSSGGSADNPSSTQRSADNADSNMACYSSLDLSSIYAVKYHLMMRICLYQLSFLINTISGPRSRFPALSDLPVI